MQNSFPQFTKWLTLFFLSLVCRFLFCLQVKRDLADNTLQCNDNTAALMASYIVQGESLVFLALFILMFEPNFPLNLTLRIHLNSFLWRLCARRLSRPYIFIIVSFCAASRCFDATKNYGKSQKTCVSDSSLQLSSATNRLKIRSEKKLKLKRWLKTKELNNRFKINKGRLDI